MPKDDALFAAPQPAHPDEEIAREEIARYYEERLAEAADALAKVQRQYDARAAEMARWRENGEITHDGQPGGFLGEASMIASRSMSRWQRAATDAIYKGGSRAEAELLGEREKALRRWLTAKGYDLGPLSEPPPNEPRGRSPRRA